MRDIRADMTTRILIMEGLIKQYKVLLYDEEQRDAIKILEDQAKTIDQKINLAPQLSNLKQEYDKKRKNAEHFNNEITEHFKSIEGKIPDDVQNLITSCEDNMGDFIDLLLQTPAEKAKVFIGIEHEDGRYFIDNKQFVFAHMKHGKIKHI